LRLFHFWQLRMGYIRFRVIELVGGFAAGTRYPDDRICPRSNGCLNGAAAPSHRPGFPRWRVEAAVQDVLEKWLVLDRTETTMLNYVISVEN